MSFDPYQPDPAWRGNAPGGPVNNRAHIPGVFLIVLGACNLLSAVFPLVGLVRLSTIDPVVVFEQTKKLNLAMFPPDSPWHDEMVKQMNEQTPEGLRRQNLITYSIGAVAWLLSGVLVFLGGMSMVRMRGYSMAVLGSVVAALPVLSPVACCCLGEAIGIWALIVLLSADVRDSFR
jgi:hypothetical protein